MMAKLAEAKRILAALNPDTRGVLLELTDDVKSDLSRMRGEIVSEAKEVLGKDLEALEGVIPDSAEHDVQWVLARIDRVLKDGQASLSEPVIPVPASAPAAVASAAAEPAPAVDPPVQAPPASS